MPFVGDIKNTIPHNPFEEYRDQATRSEVRVSRTLFWVKRVLGDNPLRPSDLEPNSNFVTFQFMVLWHPREWWHLQQTHMGCSWLPTPKRIGKIACPHEELFRVLRGKVSSPLKSMWRHQSTLSGRWWGHTPHLREQDPRPLQKGGQQIWPPPGSQRWQMLLGPWGQFPLEKSKSGHWSTLLGWWWGHVPHLRAEDPGSPAQEGQEVQPPQYHPANLGEATMSALEQDPLKNQSGPIFSTTQWSTLEYCEWMARVKYF